MIENIEYLRHLTIISIAIRFFMSSAFGGIIGLERGRRQQAAGLRTHMMVCIGSTSTMIVSEYVASYTAGVVPGDVLRLSAQVISGIGFLGAGTIIMTKDNRVRGLTTAASLWASACMGLVIGCGYYECAVIMMLCMIFILLILSSFDIKYVKTTIQLSVFVEVEHGCQFSRILECMRHQGWNIQEIKQLDFLNHELLSMRLDLMSDESVYRPKLDLEEIRQYDKIRYIEII